MFPPLCTVGDSWLHGRFSVRLPRARYVFRKYINGEINVRGDCAGGLLARDDTAQRNDLVSRRPKLGGLIDRRVNTKYE